jgi:hypothetical protein
MNNTIQDISNCEYVYEDMQTIFTNMYNKLSWGNNYCDQYQGSSGPGSFIEYNSEYISFLQQFINKNKIKVIVEIGCGSFQTGCAIYDNLDVYYFGYDVYENIINYDKKEYMPAYKYHFDVLDCYNNMSSVLLGNLCVIKDVFQHWSDNSICVFLNYLTQHKRFKYILICNSCNQQADSVNNVTGTYRELSCDYYPLKHFNPVKVLNYNSKEVCLITT